MLPKRGCGHPGCGKLVPGREKYCDPHKTEHSADTNERRGPGYWRRYKGAWPRIRAAQLRAFPLCAGILPDGTRCQAEATQVDHIVSVERGGTHDPSNLRSLCIKCHSRKTNMYDGGLGNAPKPIFDEIHENQNRDLFDELSKLKEFGGADAT